MADDSPANEPQFIYVTTRGWKSGKPHDIEIWFVAYEGRCYLVAEHREKTHWVQNIQHDPAVTFSVGSKDAQAIQGTGRVVNREAEPQLAAAVSVLMDAKYEWSDGLIVELSPNR
jgi:uncharacterized pyridoxamine 5'-phosphate oxidase family protein